jgi:tetratricopeptide repeat protein 30
MKSVEILNSTSSGCLLYKEGRYEEALVKFHTSQQIVGYEPHLSYNIALCHYRFETWLSKQLPT